VLHGADALKSEGRAWFRKALDSDAVEAFAGAIRGDASPGQRHGASGALRRALEPTNRIAAGLLPGARPVRIVAFDKSEAINWALPWHQDRVIAVRERVEVDGFRNWTRKDGVWHVEPPIEILQRMIFLRVHIDPATEDNGAMQIALRSHTKLIASGDAAEVAAAHTTETCLADRGDVLAAKALILHRSAPSASRSPRRALRIDYSADSLPAPLQWDLAS
jgi:hypothetical protein